jgi:hypothetical protein
VDGLADHRAVRGEADHVTAVDHDAAVGVELRLAVFGAQLDGPPDLAQAGGHALGVLLGLGGLRRCRHEASVHPLT